VNGITGAVTIAEGTGITVSTNTGTGIITITNSGAGGGVGLLNGLTGTVNISTINNLSYTVEGENIVIADSPDPKISTLTVGSADGVAIDKQSVYTAADNQTGMFFGAASSLASYVKVKTSAGQFVDMQAAGGIWIDTFTTLEGTPIPATGLYITNTGMYFNSTLIYGT
jgi:hypothetical protein